MKGMQKIIAADRIRRQRAAEQAQSDLRTAYSQGFENGRASAPPVKIPASLVREVTANMADYMAREAVSQNREKSAEVLQVLAGIVSDAVRAYPWNLQTAKEFAQYRVLDRRVRFEFGIDLRTNYEIDQRELDLRRA